MTGYGAALTAGYRSDGLRAWKQNSAGQRKYFVYDGLMPICELNYAGAVSAVNIVGATGVVGRNSGGRTVLYTFDWQGSASQQFDAASGALLASYAFDAWGNRQVVASDASVPDEPWAGFGGQEGYYQDPETGLELLGHRYYDPATGRFLTRDPSGAAGGANLYQFAMNNPLVYADPDGMRPADKPIISLPGLGKIADEAKKLKLLKDCVGAVLGGHLKIKPTPEDCKSLLECAKDLAGAAADAKIKNPAAKCRAMAAIAIGGTVLEDLCSHKPCKTPGEALCKLFSALVGAGLQCLKELLIKDKDGRDVVDVGTEKQLKDAEEFTKKWCDKNVAPTFGGKPKK